MIVNMLRIRDVQDQSHRCEPFFYFYGLINTYENLNYGYTFEDCFIFLELKLSLDFQKTICLNPIIEFF